MFKFLLGITFALLMFSGVANAETSISTESKTTTSDVEDGEYSSTTTKKSMDSHGNTVEVEKTDAIDGDESESSTTIETESASGASSSYSKEVERSADGTSVTIEKETDVD